LEGPLQGIPLRIEHKPRWWLRVRLDLILDPAGNPVAGLDAQEQSGS
jgi:hypothetical protein